MLAFFEGNPVFRGNELGYLEILFRFRRAQSIPVPWDTILTIGFNSKDLRSIMRIIIP